MTRSVEIDGKTFLLYRVAGYDNAWCSNRALGLRIQRRRKKFLAELNSDAQELRAVALKNDLFD